MAEPIQVDFAGKGRRQAPRKPAVIPPERAGLKVILSIIGSVLTAIIGYYVMLPPLNPRAKEFYYYLVLVVGSFIVFLFLLSRASTQPEYTPYVKQKSLIPGIIIGVVVAFFAVAWAFSSPFFQAKRYSQILSVNEDGNFIQDIQEANFAAIPKLDEDVAKATAGRTLGDLADYVSQFVVSESTTQINYREKPVRVVGLGYADLIKWLTNTRDGLPGYVIVDMANEKSEFIRLENKIRYTDTEHFGKLLKRHLRFHFPTYMFGDPNFEIDDDNNPYWIVPRMTKTIGLLGGEDVIGIVLVDAVTGECSQYNMDEVRGREGLQWIDRVYRADLLTTQYNFHGKYAGGFWNSILGQRGVKQATDGFSYIAKDDDVFMYTGVTSATGDNSIIGFILVNQRSKDAVFYQMKGATESSAKDAAKGLVQAEGYDATFPLLINISGQPTYFLSLLDSSKVVQGYSMVNVDQYNKIKVWAKSLSACTNAYVQALKDNGINADNINVPDNVDTPDLNKQEQSVTGKIADIRSAVISGNTTYYIQLEGADAFYRTAANVNELAALLNKGDEVTIIYDPTSKGNIFSASSVALK